jgi:hypothetical protein
VRLFDNLAIDILEAVLNEQGAEGLLVAKGKTPIHAGAELTGCRSIESAEKRILFEPPPGAYGKAAAIDKDPSHFPGCGRAVKEKLQDLLAQDHVEASLVEGSSMAFA